MSTIAYAAITEQREEAKGGTSGKKEGTTGVGTYLDAVAALIPAEVLALHALIIGLAAGSDGKVPESARWPLTGALIALAVMSTVLYVAARRMQKKWNGKLDPFRMLIPPLAFVCWTMLQRATMFDAAFPRLDVLTRMITALIGAVLLGLAASALADRPPPQPAVGGNQTVVEPAV
jgi:hypothetical protein